MTTPRPRFYAPALTGLRAIAAYMVFVHHGNPFDNRALTAFDLPRSQAVVFLHYFVEQWHVGVAIFFVLSGFLIASQYADRAEYSWAWFGRYMQNRLARIYPLYLLITLVFIGCWWAHLPGWNMIGWPPASQVPLGDKVLMLGMNVSFLRGFFEHALFTGVGQGWSLTAEVCFYFAAPFVLLAAKRKPISLLLLPITALLLGILAVGVGRYSPIYLYSFMPSMQFMLNWTFFGRASEFAVGMGLAFFMRRRPDFSAGGWATLLGCLVVTGTTVLITVCEYPVLRTLVGLSSYASIALNNLVLPVGVAVLLWGLIQEKTILRWVLETKIFEALGKSSYAFYLVHFGLLGYFLFPYTHNILLIFLITLAVSYALWRWVEEPLHRLLKSK